MQELDDIAAALRARGVDGPISSPPLAPVAPRNPWIQALGSVAFDLVEPRAELVDFDTIATVLARIPRWNGQTERAVLSVAQHCYEGAKAILRDTGRRDWAAAFALHDAHEAYMGDIATPIVRALEFIAGGHVESAVSTLKRRLDVAIHAAAGIVVDDEAARIVKLYDRRMGRTERNACMGPKPAGAQYDGVYDVVEPVEGCDLSTWSPQMMAVRYRRLLGELLPCFDR